MRTKRLFIPLLAAALFATSCSKEYINKEYTVIEGMQTQIVDYVVRASNWTLNNGYYEALLEVPEITRTVVNEGNVLVSRKDDDNGRFIFTALPAMRTECILVDGHDYFFTTFTDYEWSQGRVNIYVTTSDLDTSDNPGDQVFRLYIQY